MKQIMPLIAVLLALSAVSAGCSSASSRDSSELYSSDYYSDDSTDYESDDDSDDDISDYFTEPIRIDNHILVSFKQTVAADSDEFAAAVLTGLILAYTQAESGDTVGVIITTDDGETNAYAVEVNDLNAFADDQITSDELINRIVVVSVDD